MAFTANERLFLLKETGKLGGSVQALSGMLASESILPVQAVAQAEKVRDEAEALLVKIGTAQS